MQALSAFFPNKASLYTRRTILTNEKKWITIHTHSRYGGDLAVSISKTLTTMLRHFDQEERQPDSSGHWDSIKSVLVRKFAHEGVRDFSDEACLQKIFEGSIKKRFEYYKIWNFYVFYELFKDTLVDGKMTRPTGSLNLPLVGQMLG